MGSQSLIHNRANPVTVDVRRVSNSSTGESAVVKTISPSEQIVVPHWVAGADPSHWNYWKREALAYSSGLTDAFAGSGVRGPKLLDTVERADGSVELWLEDVVGRSGHDLTIEDHARFAESMGRGQGAVAAAAESEGKEFSMPFLSKHWIRSYALSRPAGQHIYDDVAAWEHPVVIEGLGDSRHRIRERFGELYRAAPKWFDLLEALPRTLCHLDYWPNNAIAGDSAEGPADDVLIDWAFLGDGAVGEDPGNWIPDTFFDHFMEPERFGELESVVWGSYAEGLESSDWQMPLEYARLGMCASAVKYIWLPGLMVANADHSGPTGYGGQEGYPLAEVFRRRGVIFEHLLEWIDEAAVLASRLGVGFDA